MTAEVTAANAWAGANLRALRAKRKYTQEELAELAGIDRPRYNALENGRHKITMNYAKRIAPHLKVKPKDLLPPPIPDEVPPETPLDRLARLEERAVEGDAFAEGVSDRLLSLEAEVENIRRLLARRASDAEG